MGKSKVKKKKSDRYSTQTTDVFNPFPLRSGEIKTLTVCKDLAYTKGQTIKCSRSTDKNSYFEAVVEYCNRTGMEIEVASSLINSRLKSKIEMDAQDLNLLPKSAKLPI